MWQPQSRFVPPLLLSLTFLLGSASSTTVTLTITNTVVSERSPGTKKVEVVGLDDCSTDSVSTLLVIFNASVSITYEGKHATDIWAGSELNGGSGRLQTVLLPPSLVSDSLQLVPLQSIQAISGEATSCFISAHLVSSQYMMAIVIGTFADGTVWADTIMLDEEADVKEIEIEYGDPPGDFDDMPIQGEDDGTLLELNVPFTSEALCQEAGLAFPCDFSQTASIISRILFFVGETNNILISSNSNLRVQGIYAWRTSDFTEDLDFLGTSFGTVMSQMQTGNDGVFEEPNLLSLRDEACADVVALITSRGDATAGGGGITFGRAFGIGPSSSIYTFIASLESLAISGFTFAHELGHVLVSFLWHVSIFCIHKVWHILNGNQSVVHFSNHVGMSP
jgi:hypothetical protein